MSDPDQSGREQPSSRRYGAIHPDRLTSRRLSRRRHVLEKSRSNRRKNSKNGAQEMNVLMSLVPGLREREGSVTQVDVIEETISYIDELHRRIGQRFGPDFLATAVGQLASGPPGVSEAVDSSRLINQLDVERAEQAVRQTEADLAAAEPAVSFTNLLSKLAQGSTVAEDGHYVPSADMTTDGDYFSADTTADGQDGQPPDKTSGVSYKTVSNSAVTALNLEYSSAGTPADRTDSISEDETIVSHDGTTAEMTADKDISVSDEKASNVRLVSKASQ